MVKTFIRIISIISALLLAVSCNSAATPNEEIQFVRIYATSAAQAWLLDVYSCAPPEIVIKLADDATSADLFLRIGEPDFLALPAYQIDSEDILIVTHPESSLQDLNKEEAQALFAGQVEALVVVWVYSSGGDVQGVFERSVMQGRSVSSYARLATSPKHMSDALSNEVNTVGILPRGANPGDLRILYTIPDVPVLGLVKEEPQGAIKEILACLQK